MPEPISIERLEEIRTHGHTWLEWPLPAESATVEQAGRDITDLLAENDRLRAELAYLRDIHAIHQCDEPGDCLCADDRQEAGGDVCGHCRNAWPCVTHVRAGRALRGGKTS